MAGDIWGVNLDLSDFEVLLSKDDLEEEPVPIQVFVTDKKYLGLEYPLSDIQLEIARHTTQVFKPETLITLEGSKFLYGMKGQDYYDKYTVNEVICQLGKGSGKDHTSRISLAYIAYLMHCLRNPLKYYGKASGVYIDLVNLAVNAKQAQQVFFDPLKNLLMRSPWANDVGFEPRVQEIFWFDRPVRMFSGHSEAEGWEGYEVLLVVLDEISAFKALPNTTPVLTPNGWVKNGSLMAGDYVIGKDGKANKVVGVYPQGEREVFEVHFNDGSSALCSDDHYWTVNEYSDGRRCTQKTLRLKDFKNLLLPTGNKQYRYSIPRTDAVEFGGNPTLLIDPYIMGILLSEGSLGTNAKFSCGDEYIIEKIREKVSTLSTYSEIDYCIPGLAKELDALGLLGTKSDTKFIPDAYLYASIEDRRQLLAGLMDGDGTPARGRGSYTTVSERLKNDFIELCRSLGGVPAASKHASWYKDKDGKKVECLDKWMICPRLPFNPFSLPRKADGWKETNRSFEKRIVDVKSLEYKEEMTCIKVENDDGLYVINDYIVTHNTDQELKNELRSKGSASVIYEMARASITSRFPRFGKVVLLSFPRFKGDFIQQRYKSVMDDINEQRVAILPENEGNKGILRERTCWALKAATWEVNPTREREEFNDEYARDPVMARARYECDPPEMEDAYFRDSEAVRRAFLVKENPIDEDGLYKEWFNGTNGHPRFIHIDLGLKRDRAALCMVHSPGAKKIKTSGGIETLPIVEQDFLRSWEALPYQEIDFASIRYEVQNLARRFPVVSVTFDQWQSADMIQSLRSMGINADLHTVKKTDYDTLSTAIYDGRFRGYWNELLVEDELLKLRLLSNTKVDHPTKGSKDLADAVAGACFMCIDNFISDIDVEVEILDEVDYDALTDESVDKIRDAIYNVNAERAKKNVARQEIPQELNEWLYWIKAL